MAVVVEKDALIFGRFAELVAELLGVLESGIKVLLKEHSAVSPRATTRRPKARARINGRKRGSTHQLVPDLLAEGLKLPLQVLTDLLDWSRESGGQQPA